MLNCLMVTRHGERVELFDSGDNIGEGKTSKMDQKKIGDNIYIDLPGLNDICKRKQATDSITETLKQGGEYLAVFVLTLESGKVRPSDLETIKSILLHAPDIKQYGIIVNKLSKPVYDAYSNQQNKQKLQKTFEGISANKNIHILFLRNFPELEGKENATLVIPELKNFIDNLPNNMVYSQNIVAGSIPKTKEDIEKDIQFLRLEQDKIIRAHEEEKRKEDERREIEKKKQEEEKIRIIEEAERVRKQQEEASKAEMMKREEEAHKQAAADKAELERKEKEEKEKLAAIKREQEQEIARKNEELRRQQEENARQLAAAQSPSRKDPVKQVTKEVRRIGRRLKKRR